MRKLVILFVLASALVFLPFQYSPSMATSSNNCLTLSAQQYLEASSKLIPLTSEFTVEFDFYLTKDSQSYAEVISQGAQPNSFYIGVNPQLGIRAGDTWIDTGSKMPVKKWVHIALTRSANGKGVFYIDGKVASTIDAYQLNGSGTNTRIGAQYDPSAAERINGCIDNLMIWKTARSSEEVSRDALVKSSFTDSNLIAYYNFDSAGSSGLIESSSGSAASLKPLTTPEFLPVANPVSDFVIDFAYGGGLMGTAEPTGGPGFYVTADLKTPFPDNYRSGFGWYSTAWSISPTKIDNFQLGLSSTWIGPDNRTVSASTAQKLCTTGTNTWVRNAASDPNSGTYGLYLFQTIEGSLGWWGGEKFRTIFPKYMANVTQNCYSSEVATPGWGFFTEQPTARSSTGLIQISNQILMPPDGMTFEADDTAPQLGVTWHSLNLPRFDRAFGSEAGENSWTLFMNSTNFKGPLVFVAPQFWVDGSKGNPLQRNLTLDKRPGTTSGLASEWNSIPFYKYTDSSGKVSTKIPEIQFPVDASGNFAISRDFQSYSSKAISADLWAALSGTATLPTAPSTKETFGGILVGNSSRVFQDGKTLGTLAGTLAAKGLENGNAYGFTSASRSTLVKLPQYFVDSNSTRSELADQQVPAALKNAKFNTSTTKSTFVYKYPSWWDASPAASEDLTTQLNDGTTVVYRWYKFVDQPALQRFELNDSEKGNLQTAVIKMQKDWAKSPMMAEPSKGSLVSFDSGLLTSPPKGFEFGYVPIVIKQFMSSEATPIVTPTAKPTPTVTPTPIETPSAKASPVAKKVTITCVKGKSVKKVTAVAPKCPVGFKKKA